jgi:ABC-2 type transport system permease protein
MLRGLWTLTWIEIKIFVREPLGLIGTLGVPLLLFLVLGRALRGSGAATTGAQAERALPAASLAVFAAILIAISAALSLITIIAIYREGGILKRLRATPLQPHVILGAHVIVKLLFSLITLALLVLVGRRILPAGPPVPVVSVALALVLSTLPLLALGFLVASLVPTARFAQPLASLLFYPMVGVSGLFVPVDALPAGLQIVARVLPLTYGVSLLRGIWQGHLWSAHLTDIAVLAATVVVFTVMASAVFRWE